MRWATTPRSSRCWRSSREHHAPYPSFPLPTHLQPRAPRDYSARDETLRERAVNVVPWSEYGRTAISAFSYRECGAWSGVACGVTGGATQHESRGSDRLAEARRAAGQNSRTATEPPIDVMAFLKPRLKTSSAQQSARATDMLVRNATSETSGIASSTGRRRARSRRRRCRYAHFHYVMWRHLVKYSSARV